MFIITLLSFNQVLNEPSDQTGVRCNVESANLEILNVESLNVEQYNEFLLRCQMSETARRRR